MRNFKNGHLLKGIFFILLASSCYNKKVPGNIGDKSKHTYKYCLPDPVSALAKGKELLINRFQIADTSEYIFSVGLLNDSTWRIVARDKPFETAPQGNTLEVHPGGVIVLINRNNCNVIGFGVAK